MLLETAGQKREMGERFKSVWEPGTDLPSYHAVQCCCLCQLQGRNTTNLTGVLGIFVPLVPAFHAGNCWTVIMMLSSTEQRMLPVSVWSHRGECFPWVHWPEEKEYTGALYVWYASSRGAERFEYVVSFLTLAELVCLQASPWAEFSARNNTWRIWVTIENKLLCVPS